MQDEFVEALASAGIDFVAALPSSSLAKLQEKVAKDARFTTVFASNEGEGAAICAGAWLGGKKPALIMENSGITFASYSVLRLHAPLGIPLLLVMDYRGDIGDANWWAIAFGWSIGPMLTSLRIPFSVVESAEEFRSTAAKMWKTSLHSKYPCAVILRYGTKV
ncbi:MAG TPA: hypothetical protein VFF30_18690 [Nitrososphaerales archaeon]|nr:hypothetical protein [Nitrososphaerales archaeon]